MHVLRWRRCIGLFIFVQAEGHLDMVLLLENMPSEEGYHEDNE